MLTLTLLYFKDHYKLLQICQVGISFSAPKIMSAKKFAFLFVVCKRLYCSPQTVHCAVVHSHVWTVFTYLNWAARWVAPRQRLQQRGWQSWAAQRDRGVPGAAWLTEPHRMMSDDLHPVLPGCPPMDLKNWTDWSLCGPDSCYSLGLCGLLLSSVPVEKKKKKYVTFLFKRQEWYWLTCCVNIWTQELLMICHSIYWIGRVTYLFCGFFPV